MSAASDDEPAVVWQGFRHGRTYNHRLNRLGSWIEHGTRASGHVEAPATHSAASGSGEDEASFTGFHTAVRANGVVFSEVTRTFHISSREVEPQAFPARFSCRCGWGGVGRCSPPASTAST